MPVYGVEKYIERCARSLFEQTYQNIEYIFVDDCTQDKSIEILEKVIKDYPARIDDVKIIHNSTNKGLAKTRFIGIGNCTSDFLYNIDSDDYLEKEAIQLLVDKQLETGADIVSSHIYINENEIYENFIHPDYLSTKEMLVSLLSQISHHELCGRLIRKSLFFHSDINPVDGHNFGEDWIITPKLVYYAKTVALVDKFLYHYNKSNANSYTFIVDQRLEYEQQIKTLFILKDFFVRHKEDNCVDVLSNHLVALLQKALLLGIEKNDKEYYRKMYNYCGQMDELYSLRIWGGGPKMIIKRHLVIAHFFYIIRKHLRSIIGS